MQNKEQKTYTEQEQEVYLNKLINEKYYTYDEVQDKYIKYWKMNNNETYSMCQGWVDNGIDDRNCLFVICDNESKWHIADIVNVNNVIEILEYKKKPVKNKRGKRREIINDTNTMSLLELQ